MNFDALTTEQFAAQFPRAAADENAVSYVIAEHNPRDYGISVPADMIPAGLKAVQVGYTNKSKSKRTTRWALVPGDAA